MAALRFPTEYTFRPFPIALSFRERGNLVKIPPPRNLHGVLEGLVLDAFPVGIGPGKRSDKFCVRLDAHRKQSSSSLAWPVLSGTNGGQVNFASLRGVNFRESS